MKMSTQRTPQRPGTWGEKEEAWGCPLTKLSRRKFFGGCHQASCQIGHIPDYGVISAQWTSNAATEHSPVPAHFHRDLEYTKGGRERQQEVCRSRKPKQNALRDTNPRLGRLILQCLLELNRGIHCSLRTVCSLAFVFPHNTPPATNMGAQAQYHALHIGIPHPLQHHSQRENGDSRKTWTDPRAPPTPQS